MASISPRTRPISSNSRVVSLLSELRVMRQSFQETTAAIMEIIEKPFFTDAVRKSMAAMIKSPIEC